MTRSWTNQNKMKCGVFDSCTIKTTTTCITIINIITTTTTIDQYYTTTQGWY